MLARTTLRQYRVWMAWREAEWNRPSRTDHYLMQLTAETRRAALRDGRAASLEDFRINFQVAGAEKPRSDPEMRLRMSKAFWTMVKNGPKKTIPPRA